MTPQQLITEMQAILGDQFKVAEHPVKRAEPQFDVFPEPKQTDDSGRDYCVTFSIRSRDLEAVTNPTLLAAQFAVAVERDLTAQIARGSAAPLWQR